MIKNKKIIFIFPIILFSLLIIFVFLNKKLKQKEENIDAKNSPKEEISRNTHVDSKVICLEPKDFPSKLNIFENYNNLFVSEILNFCKQDIVDEKYAHDAENNEITLQIKPNIKFEDGTNITSEVLKYTLKTYIDCDLGKDLIPLLDSSLNEYIIEYRLEEKNKILDNLIKIEDEQKIKIKLKTNVLPSNIINHLNRKIFLITLKESKTNDGKNNIKDIYKNQKKLLSYGDYQIFQFNPKQMRLHLKKISSNNNIVKEQKENIIYLIASKQEQHNLFKEGKMQYLEPLEDIIEDTSYNDHIFNKEFLEDNKYKKEFILDDWQLFIIFDLTKKENFLKFKILEQLNYFQKYFTKKNHQSKENTKIAKISQLIHDLNNEYDQPDISEKYSKLLDNIFEQDQNSLYKTKQNLEKWNKTKLSHNILQDENLRKAFYFALDREKIIKEIFPFYKPSCYPVSSLSQINYSDKETSPFLHDFLDHESSMNSEYDLIKKSFNPEKAKHFFDLAWDKLSPEEQKNKIILKTKYNLKDKKSENFFNYLKKTIENIFENKIILESSLTETNDIIQEIQQKNNQTDNLSSIIEDFYYSGCDLYIDFHNTLNYTDIMLLLLTKFYRNDTFSINFTKEFDQMPPEQQKILQEKIKYASKEFSSINEQKKLEGNIELLHAFFINKCNNDYLDNNIKPKINLKLFQELEKKYFKILPAIPLCIAQKCIITLNK